MKKLIDVYPYRIKDTCPEFLVLKRAAKKIYAMQWRMIGGKVDKNEKSFEAALREIKEEIGLKPTKFWAIPSVNQFYEPDTDTIHSIPAFAAELSPSQEIILDKEHVDFKWIKFDQIDQFIPWPEQRRLMKLVHQLITDEFSEILPQWLIQID